MNKRSVNQYNLEELKAYIALPAKKKLQFLEQMNAFFLKAMPSKSKTTWTKLRAKGW